MKSVILNTKDAELLADLRESVYIFSGAKTYQQTRALTDELTDENGAIRSFSDFNKAATKILQDFNVRYLAAERNNALACGMMGAQWNRIQKEKDIFPYLQLSVVDDKNTSDICRPLDGLCKPVDDAVWKVYYPPNHFNCRTIIKQLDKFDAKESSDEFVKKATKHADDDMECRHR